MDEGDGTVQILNVGTRTKKRSVYRKSSYRDKDPLCVKFRFPCKHKCQKTFKCQTLTIRDIVANRKLFFKSMSKVDHDIFLTRLPAPYDPQNRGKSTLKAKSRNRKLSCTYHLYVDKKMVTVCKLLFKNTFSLGEKRLRNLNLTLFEGKTPKEGRGGDRKSGKSIEKKQKFREFLNMLPAQESHYNRLKSKRIYLSSELNAARLLKLYNNSVPNNLRISRTMFYKIFTTEYNIGFKSPATDVCSACILWANRIKSESDTQKKQILFMKKRVHKLRSNAFYDLLRTPVDNCIQLCFDLQKVLPLSRTPIQDAYYSRQISLYNFCIVDVDKNTSNFYIWDETQASRGSNEIGSALLSYLDSLIIPENITLLRLFCDGCGGQNKNSHILHLLIYWLNKHTENVKEITMIFPVRGHSFLPADRIFGRIEKDIRKQTLIRMKEEYIDIIQKHGNIVKIETDWQLYDLKELEVYYKKIQNIQTAKRLKIKKVRGSGDRIKNITVCLYENYRFESGQEQYQTLLKRGKRHCQRLKPQPIGRGLGVNKKKDVPSLLVKQFGEEWVTKEPLQWYKNILLNNENTIDDDEEDHEGHDDEGCICMEPDFEEVRV